jgi:hypothetical protein
LLGVSRAVSAGIAFGSQITKIRKKIITIIIYYKKILNANNSDIVLERGVLLHVIHNIYYNERACKKI